MHRFRSWTLDPPDYRTQRNRLLPIEGGDGSSLSLDFTTGILDNRISFTRSSTGTYINSSGYVTNAAVNQPRFDYNPTTLQPLGLLIESSATNLLRYSSNFNPATTGGFWGGGGYNYSNGSTSLDGVNVSQRLTVSSNSGATCSQQQSATVSATSCTFSVWWKNGNHTTSTNTALRSIAVRNATTATIILRFHFDPTTLAITYVTGSTGANIIAYPNGWYRITATVTSGITSGDTITGYFAGLGGSVNNELGVYSDWWGAQLETGSGASSYISTEASTATRNADECQILNLATMGFNASEGTIYTDVGNRLNTGSNRNYTFLPVSGFNNQIFEGSGSALNVYSSGSFVAQIGSSSISVASKIAAAYAVNDYAVSVNGGAVATDTNGALPSSLTKLTIGGSIVNAAAYANGCIRMFKYWPTRLTNAQLQSLTT